MNRKYQPQVDYTSIVCLLKEFDINYMTDEDCDKLCDIDGNEKHGVETAVELLLKPEFDAFGTNNRLEIPAETRMLLSNPNETFEQVFNNVALGFATEVIDKRQFIQRVVDSISPEK